MILQRFLLLDPSMLGLRPNEYYHCLATLLDPRGTKTVLILDVPHPRVAHSFEIFCGRVEGSVMCGHLGKSVGCRTIAQCLRFRSAVIVIFCGQDHIPGCLTSCPLLFLTGMDGRGLPNVP